LEKAANMADTARLCKKSPHPHVCTTLSSPHRPLFLFVKKQTAKLAIGLRPSIHPIPKTGVPLVADFGNMNYAADLANKRSPQLRRCTDYV
jgi:hypothetical protein